MNSTMKSELIFYRFLPMPHNRQESGKILKTPEESSQNLAASHHIASNRFICDSQMNRQMNQVLSLCTDFHLYSSEESANLSKNLNENPVTSTQQSAPFRIEMDHLRQSFNSPLSSSMEFLRIANDAEWDSV